MNRKTNEKQLSFLRLSSEAQSHLHHGKKTEALKCYDDFLAQYPDDIKAFYGKGMIYYEFNEFEKAIENFDLALKVDETHVDSLYAKGVVLNAQGFHEDAIALFDKIIQLEENFALAWLAKGYALLEVNKAEEALECFLQVEQLNNRLDVSTGKGHAYRLLQQLKKAKKSYLQALSTDPYDADALYGLGAIAFSTNKLKEATDLLYKCVAQDDDHLSAWEILAKIYQKTNQQDKEQVARKRIAQLKEK